MSNISVTEAFHWHGMYFVSSKYSRNHCIS